MKAPKQTISDDLLIAYLLQECSTEDKDRINQWLLEDAAHQKKLEQLQWVWNESHRIESESTINEMAAWEHFKQLKAHRSTQLVALHPPFTRILVAVAAAALIALAIWWWIPVTTSIPTQSSIALETSIKDTLPDGTIVTLNKNSRISFPEKFIGSSRPISMQGEAYFEVAHDKNKPFIITINNVRIQVLGTSFNVNGRNGQTEIIVESGKVMVSTTKDTTYLLAGQQVAVDQMGKFNVLNKNGKLYQYYRTKVFVCDNTPLAELVAILNETYKTKIVIGNKALERIPISTTFVEAPIAEILQIIAETFELDIIRRNNEIILQ